MVGCGRAILVGRSCQRGAKHSSFRLRLLRGRLRGIAIRNRGRRREVWGCGHAIRYGLGLDKGTLFGEVGRMTIEGAKVRGYTLTLSTNGQRLVQL